MCVCGGGRTAHANVYSGYRESAGGWDCGKLPSSGMCTRHSEPFLIQTSGCSLLMWPPSVSGHPYFSHHRDQNTRQKPLEGRGILQAYGSEGTLHHRWQWQMARVVWSMVMEACGVAFYMGPIREQRVEPKSGPSYNPQGLYATRCYFPRVPHLPNLC